MMLAQGDSMGWVPDQKRRYPRSGSDYTQYRAGVVGDTNRTMHASIVPVPSVAEMKHHKYASPWNDKVKLHSQHENYIVVWRVAFAWIGFYFSTD